MNKEQEAYKLIQKALKNIRYDDVAHRAFLKPIEIALKTHRTQMIYEDCAITPGALPKGLKIAVGSPDSSKKALQDVFEITSKQTFNEIREKNQDNMLTLLKKKSGMKLAICVCMYSQTKQMLKSTLIGIAENISNMVAYEHIPPDDIGVFVIMDGIQKVDKSIVEFFQDMEKSNHINLGDNVAPSLNDKQMNKKYNKLTKEEINEMELKNVSNYLFDPAQLDERNNLRFTTVRDQYLEVKELHKKCKEVNKIKAVYKDLPPKIQQFFIEEARRFRRSDHDQTEEQVQQLSDEILLEEYTNDVDQNRALVSKALEETDKYCSNYLSNKNDLSYLSYFRKKIYFDKSTTHKGTKIIKKKHGRQENFNKQFDNSRPHTVMNLFMCCKYANAGKLSSHNWFLNGFCKELRPKYCVLMDVGLKPDTTSILKMYKYMHDNKNIGGVCGYMSLKMEMADTGHGIKNQCHDCCSNCITNIIGIQRTQQVEYHIAHVIDKPFEASFGFIHVLPGAFSAYNMNAIHNYDDKEDDILLKNYFKSISDKIADRQPLNSRVSTINVIMRTLLPQAVNGCCVKVDPKSDEAMLYNENVYLAEDRILCMGIHKRGYDMAFLPDAYAEVDPMTSIPDLMGQRKRWMNGSYFAFNKVKKELAEFERRHGCELGLNIQILYLTFMNALVYFAPAIFLFTFHIAFLALRQDVLEPWLGQNVKKEILDWFVYTIDFIYVLLLMLFFFFSLHIKNNNKKFKPLIYITANTFGFLIYFVVAAVLVDIIRGLLTNSTYLTVNPTAGQTLVDSILVTALRYMLIASFVFYFIPVLLFWIMFCRFDPLCQTLIGFPAFLFYTPTYLILLNVYSLCKMDDMSWGTKGLDIDSDDTNTLAKQWKLIKYIHVMKYMIWNIILGSVLSSLGQYEQYKFWLTFGLVTMVGLTLIIKTFIGFLYLLIYRCRSISFNKDPKIDMPSRVDDIIHHYQKDILDEVRQNLDNIKQQYLREDYRGSFIQASRTNRYIEHALKNHSIIQKQRSVINRQHSTKLIKKGKKKQNHEEDPSKEPINMNAQSNENLHRVDLDDDFYENPERPSNQEAQHQSRPQNSSRSGNASSNPQGRSSRQNQRRSNNDRSNGNSRNNPRSGK